MADYANIIANQELVVSSGQMLMHFDLSQIPSTVTISDAKIVLTKTDGEDTGFLLKEITNTQRNAQSTGIQITTIETNLTQEEANYFTGNQTQEFSFTQTGLEVLQAWLTNSWNNQWISFFTTSEIGITLASIANENESYRPQLIVHYSDITKPSADVSYHPTTTTTGNVLVILEWESEAITVTNNDWSTTHTFTGNGTFTFEFTDVAGNTGTTIANVDWIIQESGTIGTIQIPDTANKQDVQAAFTEGWYQKWKGSISSVSSKTLVGTSAIDLSDTKWKACPWVPFIMQSTDAIENKKAEIQFPWCVTFEQDNTGFAEVLNTPEFLDTATIQDPMGQEQKAVISLEWTGETITIEDEFWNTGYATIKVPVPDTLSGELISVFSSNDWENWSYLTSAIAQTINNYTYVRFETSHFTIFSLGSETGTFTINNDADVTTGLSVTLNSIISWAVQMRFGNSIDERDAANWISYATGYTRTLTGFWWDGIKRIYAQFSWNGTVRNVQDSIIYDTSSWNLVLGLLARIDSASGNATTFFDASNNGNNFTKTASPTTWSASWETYMIYNGTTQYAGTTNDMVTTFPFSMSAWIKTSRTSGISQTIVNIARSNSNRYRGILITWNKAAIVANNNATENTTLGTTNIQAGKRYHIVGIFNADGTRKLYVDGQQEATWSTAVSFSNNSSNQWNIGRMGDTSPDRFFSGAIDEVRIYNIALTPTQISSLYINYPTFDPLITNTSSPVLYGELTNDMRNISLNINGNSYATTDAGSGKRKTSPLSPALAAGTYAVRLDYTNVYWKTWSILYISWLTIFSQAATWFHIDYNITGRTSGNVISTLNGLDKTRMITNNQGEENYVFTGNGSFTYYYTDQVGNTWAITATVTWIDKTMPIFSWIISWTTYYTWVTITFADANLSWAILSGTDNNYYSGNFSNTWYRYQTGTYIFTVYDKAGNHTWAVFTIAPPLTTQQIITNTLLSNWYITGSNTSLYTGDNTILVWTASINFAPFTGNLLTPVILQSTNTFWGKISEVEFPDGVILKTRSGNAFTGILNAPVFKNTGTVATMTGQEILSVMDIGSGDHIVFKDSSGNDSYATFRMPVPGKTAGDLIDIYYSEDNINFTYLNSVNVQNIQWSPYVIFPANHFTIFVTTPNNGTGISADKAANSTNWAAYTLLNNIVIWEWANTDFWISQSNVTLILTPPNNWKFKTGSWTISYTAGMDITAATINVASTGATITYSTNGAPNRIDTMTISWLQIQAISGNIIPASGNILRTCANSGTATMNWIICDSTNFWTFSQIAGAPKNLVITLSGQQFIPWNGNSGTAVNQNPWISFVIPKITAIDQFYNIADNYSGFKTLNYTGPGGTPTYTTGVNFSTGQSTTTLTTTLTQEKTWVSITVSDGILTWIASSLFDVRDTTPPTASTINYSPSGETISNVTAVITGFSEPITGVNAASHIFTGNWSFVFTFSDLAGNTWSKTATVTRMKKGSLTYNTTKFKEDIYKNDGSVSTIMSINIVNDTFIWNIATGGFITFTNIPAGLTWFISYISPTEIEIILSWKATNHTTGNSINNLGIMFNTGAFNTYAPTEIIWSNKTGINVIFIDPNPTLTFDPIADTMIDADTDPTGVGNCANGKCQNFNYGQMDYLCASNFGSKIFFKFDLNTIPTGAIITDANIRLNRYHIAGATSATGFLFSKMINNPWWIEGSWTATTALTGEPSYQRKQQYQTRRNNGIEHPGSPGMFDGSDYDMTHLLTVNWFTGNNTSTYNQTFIFNSWGREVLQSRRENTNENEWFVMGNTNDLWLCTRSKEYVTTGSRPLLSVSYYADTTAPEIVKLNPGNNQDKVQVWTNLFITFDENIFVNSGKNLTIKKISDNSTVETINLGNTWLALIYDNKLAINPTNDLASFTEYYIEIDSWAIKDIAGNTFIWFTGSNTRRFRTLDTTQVGVLINTFYTWIQSSTGILWGTLQSFGSWYDHVISRGITRSTIPGFYLDDGIVYTENGYRNTTWSFSFLVTGLLAGTQIYFRSFADNTYSTWLSEQIGFITKTATPTLLAADDLDNHTFRVNRTQVTGATSYKLRVSTQPDFSSYLTWYEPMTGLIWYRHRIDNLSKDTMYYYKIAGVNSAGDSYISEYTGTRTTFYSTPIAHLKLDELTWEIAADSAWYNHIGIKLWWIVMNQTGIDNRAFYFNGLDTALSIVNFDYGRSFSVSFWFKTTATGNNVHLYSHGGDNAANSMNVVLDAASGALKTYFNGQQNILNLTGNYNNLVDGNRHYYTMTVNDVWANSWANKDIMVYIDGAYQLHNTSISSWERSPVNNIVIGRMSDTTGWYYSGYVDDVRIFNQVLDASEILDLYNQYAQNTIIISCPWVLSLSGDITTSNSTGTIEQQFTGYFKVYDKKSSNSGYYTTLSISDLSWTYSTISKNNIYLQATGVTLIQGTANTWVYIHTWIQTYQAMTGVVNYIRRDPGNNNDKKGEYGNLPRIKVLIPPYTIPDDYTATITYTLYEN